MMVFYLPPVLPYELQQQLTIGRLFFWQLWLG